MIDALDGADDRGPSAWDPALPARQVVSGCPPLARSATHRFRAEPVSHCIPSLAGRRFYATCHPVIHLAWSSVLASFLLLSLRPKLRYAKGATLRARLGLLAYLTRSGPTATAGTSATLIRPPVLLVRPSWVP